MGKRAGIQLCYPFEEKRLGKWEPPYIIQPKLDGERCRALISGDNILLVSSEMNVISSVPHINAAIRDLNLPVGTELDGELYVHGWSFEEIHSVVSRTVTFHPRFEEMQLHIFDYIPPAEQPIVQGQRVMNLEELNLSHSLQRVPYHCAKTLEEIMKWFNHFLDESYEGIIIRNAFYLYERKRSTGIMKFKPKKLDHYQITACLEAIDLSGNPKNTLGAFQCIGSDGTLFKVGAGTLTHEERDLIWRARDQYVGMVCEVQYQNITPNGVPRFGLCFKRPTEIWQSDESPFDILGIKR